MVAYTSTLTGSDANELWRKWFNLLLDSSLHGQKKKKKQSKAVVKTEKITLKASSTVISGNKTKEGPISLLTFHW